MQLCAAFKGSVPCVLARRRPLHIRSEAAATTQAAPAAVATKQLRLKIGAKNIPNPSKAHYGGEDAFFISQAGGGAMGIADGVGGWQEEGINPADYSKTFMAVARQYLEECATLFPQQDGSSSGSVMSTGEWLASLPEPFQKLAAAATDATAAATAGGSSTSSSDNGSSGNGNGAGSTVVPASSILESSLSSVASVDDGEGPRTALGALQVAHATTQLPGSSTACVVRLDAAKGVLDAANLGDSGFMIIRNGELHFQSPVMQHFFDCPLQFGMPPHTDYAEDAEVFSLRVQPGDAIVMATDGLLDNMFPEDFVRLAPRSAAEVEQAAIDMAELASRNAADPTFESPYTQEALQEGIDLPIWEKLMKASWKDGKFELGKLRGGKMDDITVVVGYVTEEEVGAEEAAQAAAA